jgi:1-acyl-sn-glycerol-3-phosphate acyltransferase
MRRLAYWYMRLTGWKILGEPPTAKKFIAIGWPHTSNWDYVLFLGVTRLFSIPAKAIGKHTLVEGPFGWLFRRAVIPIRRGTGQGLVETMAEAFDTADELTVVVSPEGTRKYTDHWKSGFYHIARAAGVPLVPAYIDYERKLAEIGPPMTLTGDVKTDMDALRAFMAPGRGKYPDQAAPVRLAEETT